jgi:putative hemolysin
MDEAHPGDAIQTLLHEPTRVVAAVQIGVTVFSLTAAAIAAAVLAPDFAIALRPLTHHDLRLSVTLLIVIVALLTLVIGEIVPRAVAMRHPDRTAEMVAGPLKWVERLERPLVAVVLGLSNFLVKPFGLTASFNAPVITEEEITTLLEASQKEGIIEEDEKDIIRNVISFGDTSVHTVMTPRIDMKAADVSMLLGRLINLIVDCGHSRIPLYDGNIDNIIGIVHAKDLLPSLARGDSSVDLRTLVRSPFFVPENKRVDDLLDEFRRSNSQMAIVQDEYGGTAGLVTIEDLLEELVGEIQDEYDVEEPMVVREEDGSAIVDSRLNIDAVNEELGTELSREDFDTIGGYVFGQFGRPPLQGDSITCNGLIFTIEKADGRRIQKIRICVPQAEPEDSEGESNDDQANVPSDRQAVKRG